MVLIPNSNIVVDNFKYSTEPGPVRYVYFLTHMHSDHYQGLTNDWDQGLIYCSPVTKSLLLRQFPRLTCVIALEINTVHWVSLNEDHSEGANVCFMDANHCPGAVMILFRGKMGTILHTGDFRYCREMAESEILKDTRGERLEIDILYLDNTYCAKSHAFPTQSAVLTQLITLLEAHPGTEIEVAAEILGKEEVLYTLARHFSTVIQVSEEKYRQLELVGADMDLFTRQEEGTWIRVVEKSALKHIPAKLKEGRKVLGLKLSGWKPFAQLCPHLYSLPFSLHSNYSELIQCVEDLHPGNIVFTVPGSAVGADAEEFLRKYSYRRPGRKVEGGLVTAVGKRRVPMESQCKVGKRAKVLGSRICN